MNRHQRRAAASKAGVPGAMSIATSLQFGLANHHAGRLAEAERRYRHVLSLQADNVEALHLIGCVYLETGRVEQGVASIERAIALQPDNAEFHSNLATGFSRIGKLELAVEAYGRAVDLDETKASVLIDFGLVLEKLERWAPALACYAKAVVVDPTNATAHANLGRGLHRFERFDDAIKSFDAAVGLAPDDGQAHAWRSSVLFALKRFDEALAAADQGIAVAPDTCEPHNMRGVALYRLGRFADAAISFSQALANDPGSAEVYLNRASVYVDMHLFAEASSDIEAAIAHKAYYPEAHNNKGLHALLLGDFKTGWLETEWRWKCAGLKLKDPKFAQPQWMGDVDIAGKTVLLHSDQGLGDAINFARYATLVSEKGARVILAVDAPLLGVLGTVAGVESCVDKDKTLPSFDLQCPLSSLPLAFATELDTIPASVPYVHVPNSPKWRERLGQRTRPRIGLVWSGNPDHGNDHNRSLQFSEIAPLIDLPFDFYSLQKGVRERDRVQLDATIKITQLGNELTDFVDTAALLSELDLLITADTSIAHIAGAMALPTWILLPHTPDWRWLLERTDSPWYPTVRLFRQPRPRSWGEVIVTVSSALRSTFGQSEDSQKTASLVARRCNYSLSGVT